MLGIYKSTDGGESFTFSGQVDNASDFSINYIVVDPTNPQTVFYGSNHTSNPTLNTLGGIFKSTDGGATFARVFYPSGALSTKSLAIDPQNSSIIYEIGSGVFFEIGSGVYKSTDGGASWENVSAVTGSFLTIDKASNLYIGRNPEAVCGGLYGCASHLARSSDGGRTWSDLAGLSNAPFALDPVDPSIVYGSTYIQPPPIFRVSIKGKKVVIGGHFHEGAVIRVNGESQQTEMRPHAPGEFYVELVSKKGGKKVLPGQVVPVSVVEADGVEVSALGIRPD